MELKERACNLEQNYAELRGCSYLVKLFLDDLTRNNIDIGSDRQAGLDLLSAHEIQRVEDLQFDIQYLVAHVLSGD